MTNVEEVPIPPVDRSVSVSWNPADAFARFTRDWSAWWPRKTHSIGGKLIKELGFECRVGGLIYEELVDGRRWQWGKVTAWDPPRRVAFTWHPSKDEATAQDVEVTFTPEGSGTRVRLLSTGWERLGAKGKSARKGYDIGWGSVLDNWAGKRSAAFVIFGVLSRVITLYYRVTGKLETEINKAGGRLYSHREARRAEAI